MAKTISASITRVNPRAEKAGGFFAPLWAMFPLASSPIQEEPLAFSSFPAKSRLESNQRTTDQSIRLRSRCSTWLSYPGAWNSASLTKNPRPESIRLIFPISAPSHSPLGVAGLSFDGGGVERYEHAEYGVVRAGKVARFESGWIPARHHLFGSCGVDGDTPRSVQHRPLNARSNRSQGFVIPPSGKAMDVLQSKRVVEALSGQTPTVGSIPARSHHFGGATRYAQTLLVASLKSIPSSKREDGNPANFLSNQENQCSLR